MSTLLEAGEAAHATYCRTEAHLQAHIGVRVCRHLSPLFVFISTLKLFSALNVPLVFVCGGEITRFT